MDAQLSPDQIIQLQQLGLLTSPKKTKGYQLLPLISLSGITIVSISSLILFKSHTDTAPNSISLEQTKKLLPKNTPSITTPSPALTATIQQYLLASQQYFSQAVKQQSSENVVPLINQAITTVSSAIQQFPSDPRGWEFRAKIYQSLAASQPQLLAAAISDYRQARQLNPSSVENLYSLIRLQEQAGLLSDALTDCYKLLPLTQTLDQRQQVTTEIQSLRQLLAQNNTSPPLPSPTITLNSQLIQASIDDGLIVAAPETSADSFSTSTINPNALSGQAVLTGGTKSISITNRSLKSTSQVYLTITKGGKNQNLQVLSRSSDSFTVGLETPIPEDIEFKWWIVN